jgi:hypothetical protein
MLGPRRTIILASYRCRYRIYTNFPILIGKINFFALPPYFNLLGYSLHNRD